MWERLYAIYDRQAQQILKGSGQMPLVIMYPNDNVARREFIEIINNVPQLQKHLDDYCLIQCGSINTETGEVAPSSNAGLPPSIDLQCLIMNANDAYRRDPNNISADTPTK